MYKMQLFAAMETNRTGSDQKREDASGLNSLMATRIKAHVAQLEGLHAKIGKLAMENNC